MKTRSLLFALLTLGALLLAACGGAADASDVPAPPPNSAEAVIVTITMTFLQTSPEGGGIVTLDAWDGILLHYPVGIEEAYYLYETCASPCTAHTIQIDSAYPRNSELEPLPCLSEQAEYFVNGAGFSKDAVGSALSEGKIVTIKMKCKK